VVNVADENEITPEDAVLPAGVLELLVDVVAAFPVVVVVLCAAPPLSAVAPLPTDKAEAVDTALVVVDVSGTVVFVAASVAADCPELLEHPLSTTPIISVPRTKKALIFFDCKLKHPQ